MIPIKYNLRNLIVRWGTTVMTVLGTGLVVWATVLTFGLSDGLEHALRITGDPLDLIVLRKGSTDEISSVIDADLARQIGNLAGIAKDATGRVLCSAEYVTILTKPRRGDAGTTNLVVRGLEDMGRALRPDFKIVAGRDFHAGVNEAITSQQMAQRFENLAIGEKLDINNVAFTIVGYFEAGGSAAESEVWTSVADLTGARRTPGALSIVSLRAVDSESKEALKRRIIDDKQFQLHAIDEQQFYAEQMSALFAIKSVGYALATFLTFGALFATANTMYSAVANRSREIGTLRAIGFGRGSVLSSFLLESIVLCLAGGVLGCLATLPFHGLSTGTANWATFSEITFSFRFGPTVLLRGVAMALIMGAVGGLFPALRAVRIPVAQALRQ